MTAPGAWRSAAGRCLPGPPFDALAATPPAYRERWVFDFLRLNCQRAVRWLAALIIPSCLAGEAPPRMPGQVVEHTIPLAEDGRFGLEDRDSRIEITGWDRPEVRLRAVRRGTPSVDPDSLRIEVETPPGGVRVQTRFRVADATTRSGPLEPAEVSLHVPRRATLEKISTINGSVHLRDFDGRAVIATVNGEITTTGTRGDLDLSSVEGRVRAAPAEAAPARTITLNSVSGEVSVMLPAGLTDALLNASTLRGTITPPAGYKVEDTTPFGCRFHATLGEGGAEIRVKTVTGAIRFSTAEAPRHGAAGE